jgi:hypothetical protein
MKFTGLLYCSFSVVVFAAEEPTKLGEFVIQAGPKAGQILREVASEVAPKEVTVPQSRPTILRNGTNAAVELSVCRHEFIAPSEKGGGRTTCYEFRVRPIEAGGLEWSCWAGAFSRPHGFQLFVTKPGDVYASYVREGVHLYRISRTRDSTEMQRVFLGVPDGEAKHPDALPLLPMQQLGPLGYYNMLGLGPQAWNVNVDNVLDIGAELRMTVHGTAPQPQCAFALRGGKWELLPSSGAK